MSNTEHKFVDTNRHLIEVPDTFAIARWPRIMELLAHLDGPQAFGGFIQPPTHHQSTLDDRSVLTDAHCNPLVVIRTV